MSTRHTELQGLYREARRANDQYWADLREMAARILRDFAQYLGVKENAEPSSSMDSSGPLVMGAVNPDGYFFALKKESLLAEGDSIKFSLRLSYGSWGSSDVDSTKVFDLSVRKIPDFYEVDYAGSSFKGPIFNELFDRLLRDCKESIAAVGNPSLR